MLYLTILAAMPNMTDYLIGLFGWDFMQVLWGLLDSLFTFFNLLVPNPAMWDTVWEVLFT